MTEPELLQSLLGLLGSGTVDPGFVFPALRALGQGRPAPPAAALLDALEGRPEPALAGLAAHLKSRRRLEASRCFERKRAGIAALDEFAPLLGDLPLDAPAGWRPAPPVTLDPAALDQARAYLKGVAVRFPYEVGAEAARPLIERAFRESESPALRARAFDLACSWPSEELSGLVRALAAEGRWRERAELIMTLRFGQPELPAELPRFEAPAPIAPAPSPAPAPADFLPPRPAPLPAEPEPQPEPEPEPTLFSEHIAPFLSNNWPMLAGIAMVVAGSSLLAFYTWDKHWLVRYTILPGLLAFFTAGLARAGRWLETRDAKLKGSADMLRGAAIALLPANFMAVALLAADPQVPGKALLLPAAAALYLAFSGLALRRWCAEVHEGLGFLLAPALLALNALVLLGPALVVYGPGDGGVWPLLAAGFYAGFGLCAFTIVRFARGQLSEALIEEGRVPWFFGVTLTTTFAQVLLWVHGFLRHVPSPHTYSLLVIGAGGLVLYAEQCSARFRKGASYGKDSFIGYALILLGLFMGAGEPRFRVAALEAAGAIWLAQALHRRDARHAWIAFTLLLLGGGAVGTWESFPGPWIPGLALALALAAEALGRALRPSWEELDRVGRELQGAALTAASVLAVLVQRHYHSDQHLTAGFLVAAAALFAWRAHRDQRAAYAHSAMAVLGVSLPYLGFADLSGRTLHGNTVVFGLGLLSMAWIALVRARPTPLLKQARSTVLLLYGATALAAMLLRVLFEQGRAQDLLGPQAAMALAGPLLMAAAMVFAAYFSRSLLPMTLGALILLVLFPRLKAEIQAWLPWVHWGTGLMSSVWALVLPAACFSLREAPFLKALERGEGDRFGGAAPFPFLRPDYRLFTGPLMLSAAFLAVKVDTWTLAANLAGGGVHLRAAAALVLAGAAWTLMAVYWRERADAGALVHFGWLSAASGVVFAYADRAAEPRWPLSAFLALAFLTALYGFYRLLQTRRPWAGPLLAAPVRTVLRWLTILLAAAAAASLAFGGDFETLRPLLILSCAHLCWFGLSDGEPTYGALLYFLLWLVELHLEMPGAGSVLERLSLANAAWPTLVYLGGIQALSAFMELSPEASKFLRPLTAPPLSLAALTVFAFGLAGAADAVAGRALSSHQQLVLLAVVAVTARAQACGPLALLAAALAYLQACSHGLPGPVSWGTLASPWRAAAFALALACAGKLGSEARARFPRLLEGAEAQPFFRQPALPWLLAPAATLAAFAALSHASDAALRLDPAQLPAPYLAAASFAVVGLCWPGALFFGAAVLALTSGNAVAARLYAGPSLYARGLGTNHLLCLGATATLLQLSALELFLPERARAFLHRAQLAAAGFVLALLTSTYFSDPNLEVMTRSRLALSGVMSYLAGRYFQRAARRPDAAELPYAALWEGLYHYGVTTAIWCAALMIPWFRSPYAAFPALGLPVLYFYARAELAPAAFVARYRNTAAALSFFLLALYAFRGAFQMVLFPDAPLGLAHYHFNAPFVMLLAAVMLRLHGLGGTSWLAFYAGPAMMVGSYFTLTRLPGLSPFDHPMPAAWCAFALGHFWMLFGARPSPPRAFLQRLSGIPDEAWAPLQSAWGLFLLAATQASLAWALLDYPANTLMVAPLLLGGASLAAHQALVRKSAPLFALAAVEAALALHADFFVHSWLPRRQVVWAVLCIWAAFLGLWEARPETRKSAGPAAFGLWALALLHAAYHGAASDAGLWAFGLASALGALTPRETRTAATAAETLAAGLLLLTPAWLTHFGNLHAPRPWATLLTAAAVFATGAGCWWMRWRGADAYLKLDRPRPRLADQLLARLCVEGGRLHAASLYAVFAACAFVQVAHYDRAFLPHDLGLLLGLYGAGAYAWYHEGRRARALAPYFMIQLCVIGFFAVIRRQLMLTLSFWNYEYDVWASLLVSWSLAAFKQTLPLDSREARIPLLGTLLTMPVAVMIWVLVHHLGTDTVLLVIGLYSVMFAYMGKDDRQSPYHAIAVAGFVAFVLTVFWTKLQLRALQAFVIPVGLGVLALLHLFRDKVPPKTRNDVRAVTLTAMLGSAGYYALLDDRYPLAFHLTLLGLSVLVMAVGSLSRIRVYVLLGFAGLLTDLGALLYKVLVHLDRSSRMTLIGTQVLVFGALLIFGAVAYKTHKDQITEFLDRWRATLSSWD